MRPTATNADLPTTHDICVFIHNAFIDYLKQLKKDIQVCHSLVFLILFSLIDSLPPRGEYLPPWIFGPLTKRRRHFLGSQHIGFKWTSSRQKLGTSSLALSHSMGSLALTVGTTLVDISWVFVSGWASFLHQPRYISKSYYQLANSCFSSSVSQLTIPATTTLRATLSNAYSLPATSTHLILSNITYPASHMSSTSQLST